MPVLPHSIPAATLQALTTTLATTGVEVGPLKARTRLTHPLTTPDGRPWETTYLGLMYGDPMWRLAGPGIEHGILATATDIADTLSAPSTYDTTPPTDRP
ncbi:hypothetical protein OG896_24830 [Streptomyces sp. NBC_00669]|uniref:hypothetical protein n=1 Tax=Streptomyces sp. NBC_00669 TaxID=2976011 RepID=UPI002E3131A7|nr:hypothetical protein [Streptomyces sp. NBC_00669]